MSSPKRRSNVSAVAGALLVTVLWSSSWVLIRWGLDQESLEPFTFAALRYGMAAVVLAGWVTSSPSRRRRVATLGHRAMVQIAVLGVVFYALTQGAQFVAIDNQPAATSSLVLSWTPLLVAVFGGRALGESPSRRQVIGAVAVVMGAWLYFSGELRATTVGMVAALVALGANVASSLLGRHVNRRAQTDPVVVTGLSMAVGAALLIAVGIFVEGVPAISLRAWLIIMWLAVVNTAMAFTLWNWSLHRLSAMESAAINNTMLIQIALLAWLFLGESLGYREVAGITIVTAGILLTQTVVGVRRSRALAAGSRER